MDVGTIIVIAIAALVILAIVAFATKRRRTQKLDQRRVEAHSHREEARVRNARADRAAAEAEERAARAKREQAMAEEQATAAQRERRFATEREERAAELDPDGDRDGAPGAEPRTHQVHEHQHDHR